MLPEDTCTSAFTLKNICLIYKSRDNKMTSVFLIGLPLNPHQRLNEFKHVIKALSTVPRENKLPKTMLAVHFISNES